MSITKQIFCGRLAAPDGGAPATFQVTCRLVKSLGGLESMHILGWVAVDGTRSPVSKLGITLAGASMHGKEREIAVAYLAECARWQTGQAERTRPCVQDG